MEDVIIMIISFFVFLLFFYFLVSNEEKKGQEKKAPDSKFSFAESATSVPTNSIKDDINVENDVLSLMLSELSYKLISNMIIPTFKKPEEPLYFFISLIRKHLKDVKKYPIDIVDMMLNILIRECLKDFNLSIDKFADRDYFYYKIQKENKERFSDITFDIIKTSQYFEYPGKLDLFEIQTNALKSVELGMGIFEDFDVRNKFTITLKHFTEVLVKFPSYSEIRK